jgi:hypothetical protein
MLTPSHRDSEKSALVVVSLCQLTLTFDMISINIHILIRTRAGHLKADTVTYLRCSSISNLYLFLSGFSRTIKPIQG